MDVCLTPNEPQNPTFLGMKKIFSESGPYAHITNNPRQSSPSKFKRRPRVLIPCKDMPEIDIEIKEIFGNGTLEERLVE